MTKAQKALTTEGTEDKEKTTLYFRVVRVFRGFSIFLLSFPFNGLRY